MTVADPVVDVDVDRDEAKVLATVEALLAAAPPAETSPEEFLGRQFDLGLAWVHLDPDAGGMGVDRKLQELVRATIEAAGGPDPFARNPIGYGMAGPTIGTHGTPRQRTAYLRRLFTGEEVWCQLFSEPGAGSDVASLAASARRDGDGWIIDGQKVWTTLAHVSRYGLLLTRTDPTVPKHRGMTMFLLDMQAPGVDIRPLRQMTGDAEFNEVYLSGVRIDDIDRIGAVGEGWKVAISTLMNERVAIGAMSSAITTNLEHLRSIAGRSQLSGAERATAMDLYTRGTVTRLTIERAQASLERGNPGPEGSTGKLAYTEFSKALVTFCLGLLGPAGTLYPGGYDDAVLPAPGDIATDPHYSFLRSPATTLEGGTSEVMRNILAERVLGLPEEPRSDKAVPWNQVPRS